MQPSEHVLHHAGFTAPTRQHELDHTDHTDHTDRTDHTDHTDQEFIYLPCLADLYHELYCCSAVVAIGHTGQTYHTDHLSVLCMFWDCTLLVLLSFE